MMNLPTPMAPVRKTLENARLPGGVPDVRRHLLRHERPPAIRADRLEHVGVGGAVHGEDGPGAIEICVLRSRLLRDLFSRRSSWFWYENGPTSQNWHLHITVGISTRLP